MPTVIDSLVLVLGMDASKFSKEQKAALDNLRRTEEEARRLGNSVEAQGKKLNAFFGGLKREAVALTAAFFGGRGVKEFFTYITNVDAATGRLAKTLGISTQDLSAWQGVATQTGGTAESMAGSMQGLSGAIQHFLLTGEGGFLPLLNTLNISLFDHDKKLKTTSQLYFELARAVQGMDPARARALLAPLPGMNEETINMLLLGEKALRNLYDAQVRLGLISRQDDDAATELQGAWYRASQAATSLGRAIVSFLSPALVQVLKAFEALFVGLRTMKAETKPDSLMGRLFNRFVANPNAGGAAPKPSSSQSPAGTEAYIRKAATARGIDPDVAVAVARSEGLGAYTGDQGSSFGPFQLHYGGVVRGGNAVPGLGDEFTKKTGLDARDPSTVQAQIDFALDEAKRSGWGAWHGWRGLPRAGLPGAPPSAASIAQAGGPGRGDTNTTTSTTNVGTVIVNTQATDADGVARDIGPALRRASLAGQANAGQE
jgi:hypothetical protein